MSENDFSHLVIKEYTHWTIQVHENQSYLGRCVVWCKRENATDLADATLEEQKELFIILKELRSALTKCFEPDWFNYAFLGNSTPHLHGHVVPRYAQPREYMGITFTDERYGHNFRTDHTFETPDDVLHNIKIQLQDMLR